MSIAARTTALRDLARRKQADFLQRGDLIALALTGSLPRRLVWEGSDLDFWGFSTSEDDEFLDGVIDDLYWEIDIAPASVLDLDIDTETWLNPPHYRSGDEVGLLEALSGCEILHDPTGKLKRVTTAIEERLADRAWLRERATRYLHHASAALDELASAPPIEAILYAREIASNYIVAAYWMQQGQLLTSVIRLPERLPADLRRLYCDIWALNGQAALDEFMQNYAQLPDAIREDSHSDVYNEALPAAQIGAVDGAMRYLRFTMMIQGIEEGHLDDVLPCLGLEADVAAQQQRVIRQCREMMEILQT